MAAADKSAMHESSLRILLDRSGDVPFRLVASFSEAKGITSAYAIMEGDCGGQIYLSVPMDQVNCDELALESLLLQLDGLCWNDPYSATLYYEISSPGSGIPGGMGGGVAEAGLWLHEDLHAKREAVAAYLSGSIGTIL